MIIKFVRPIPLYFFNQENNSIRVIPPHYAEEYMKSPAGKSLAEDGYVAITHREVLGPIGKWT